MKRTTCLNLGLLMLGFAVIIGCADESTTDQATEETQEVSVEEANDNAVTTSLLKLESEIFSLPSPVQTALLLKKNEIPYDESALNPAKNVERYINQFQKSLNMGVYGADLAYLSNFNNSQIKLDYFKAVEDLASDLDIRNHIDQGIVDRFAMNVDNRDSLYGLNAELFKAADQYLKENDDNEMAALILAGGWIEAIYLALEPASSSDELRERIGEQGYAARSLVALLGKSEDPQCLELASKLAALAADFQNVGHTYEYVKPITDGAERVTYLNSKSRVLINDEQLNSIASKIKEIRSFIIQ